jgi:hypothetical protein
LFVTATGAATGGAVSEEHFFLGHFEFLKIQNYIHLGLHLFHLLSCSAFSTHAECRAFARRPQTCRYSLRPMK